MESIWRRIDPRVRLAAAIGWAVLGLIGFAALVAAHLASDEAESRARADTQRLLGQFATQIRDALDGSLETRHQLLQATAAQLLASTDLGEASVRRHLGAVRAQFPEFEWIAVLGAGGRVAVSVGAEAIAQRELQVLPPPSAAAPGAVPQVQRRGEIIWAVPLSPPGGRYPGVLAARLSWGWLEGRERSLLQSLERGRNLEMLLVGADGTVLSGPDGSAGKPAPDAQAYAAGGAYLTGRDDATGGARGQAGPGWSVRVRQPDASALAPARATRRTVFVTVLLAGLVSAAAVVVMTQLLLRRLTTLARQAHEVRDGTRQALGLPRGRDEIGRIGAALAELVDHLQREKRALQTLNAELDARVAERTRRIERLADDARQAAVTRERLRLARDLHDTLAHTLMALLTQIRLVRKLRARWGEAELESELARAEEVAASGLAETRNAITQIRHNGVRESGLGAALQELLARFGERSGVATRLQADPAAAGVAGESAQTVFRIVEEALRNVERHAGAQAVEVELRSSARDGDGDGDAPRVHLVIADDGVGFDPALPRPGHYGLRGIEEQAALVGGRLRLHSAPGAGTRIELEFDA